MSDDNVPGINLPVDPETVQLYLHNAEFKASVDAFVSVLWPTYLAGLKVRAIAWEAEAENMRQAMLHQHPSSRPNLFVVTEADDAT